ncbi:TetR/AcrR family transcriptional regulator (plasmid) [Embleya sp. NBC_00888]|uniref:TetR/AcrR family transcriptional regulator n=1 Tax=Embleya sp. NBC_00888 TaxID=2975960 RepID=UPI002F90878B|nr:TetR/AcrR family transcriptional regulator [Embleya sp. NBC_00888]
MPKSPLSRSHRERVLAGAVRCLREKGYAHTTARDIAQASGTSLGSIGYHFGGVDALLEEAVGQCFEVWTRRVRDAVSAVVADGPRAQPAAALVALIDSFEELRPMAVACVESFAPAMRSAALRERLAAGYADARRAGHAMTDRAFADSGVEPPAGAEAIPALLIAICDGLMLQWLVDPEHTPDAHGILDALTVLAPVLAPPR